MGLCFTLQKNTTLDKFKSILNDLVEHNFIVAFGALALYFQTLVLVNVSLEFSHYAFLLFFASLLDYNLHKLVKSQFHLTNKTQEKQVINSKLKTTILFSILGITVCLSNLPSALYLKLSIIGSITALYSLPFLLKFKSINTIKKIPLLKTGMIAFVWTYLTLNIPIDILNININLLDIIPLFLARFFFIAAITLPFDLRDKEVDQKDGIITLAHVFTNNQIRTIIISLILAMGISMCYYLYQIKNLMLLNAYVFSGALMGWFVYSKEIKNHKYYYKILLDGLLIYQSLLVYLISKI